jgi:ABC-type antimicrobial peptide transport system permease subunit
VITQAAEIDRTISREATFANLCTGFAVPRRVLLLAAVGLAVSVPAALTASRLVKSFLFGTQPNDPAILALAGVVLLSAAILAGYAPARRASRIDPLAALRQE